MAGAGMLGEMLEQLIGESGTSLSSPEAPLNLTWDRELDAARPALRELADAYEQLLTARRVPLAVMGRCASALATLPAIAHHHPDACVVWFDAHADSNIPTSVSVPYLGGMVISGAAGLWDSGLGSGLALSNVVLVGSRDIDPDEQELIDSGTLRHVRVGIDFSSNLRAAVGDRPIYVHLDCDVLEPGIVPTEYISPGGLTLETLRAACETLAENEIVGLEIAEFEATWPDTGEVASPAGLIEALQPVLDALCRASQ